MKKIEEVLKESKPTVLVFEHVGRQNSVDTKYLIDALKKDFSDGINIIKLDTSYNGKMSMRFHLEDYPTYILYKEGQELMRESGHKSEADLVAMVRTAI